MKSHKSFHMLCVHFTSCCMPFKVKQLTVRLFHCSHIVSSLGLQTNIIRNHHYRTVTHFFLKSSTEHYDSMQCVGKPNSNVLCTGSIENSMLVNVYRSFGCSRFLTVWRHHQRRTSLKRLHNWQHGDCLPGKARELKVNQGKVVQS